MLTAQTKTIDWDWHWASISAIFGFNFVREFSLQIYKELTGTRHLLFQSRHNLVVIGNVVYYETFQFGHGYEIMI